MTQRQRKSYESAAHRAADDPIDFTLDGKTLTVAPLDYGAIAPAFDALIAHANIDLKSVTLAELGAKIEALRDAVATLLTPESRTTFATIRANLDPRTAASILSDVLGELTGANPTSPSGSTTSSSPPGMSGTDGAPTVDSTPSPSPPTESSTFGLIPPAVTPYELPTGPNAS